MAHNTEWHREYALLELAEGKAQEALYTARRAVERKNPPAGAQAAYDAALEAYRVAGNARFDFEMTGCTIVNSTSFA